MDDFAGDRCSAAQHACKEEHESHSDSDPPSQSRPKKKKTSENDTEDQKETQEMRRKQFEEHVTRIQSATGPPQECCGCGYSWAEPPKMVRYVCNRNQCRHNVCWSCAQWPPDNEDWSGGCSCPCHGKHSSGPLVLRPQVTEDMPKGPMAEKSMTKSKKDGWKAQVKKIGLKSTSQSSTQECAVDQCCTAWILIQGISEWMWRPCAKSMMIKMLAKLWIVWRVNNALKCLQWWQSPDMYECNISADNNVFTCLKTCFRNYKSFEMCDALAHPWNVWRIGTPLKCQQSFELFDVLAWLWNVSADNKTLKWFTC